MRPLTEEVKLSAAVQLAAMMALSDPRVVYQTVLRTYLLSCRTKECVLQETRTVFEKLHKFLGNNIKHLVDRKDESYVFRLQKNRVLYVRESLMRRATNVSIT